MENHTEQTATFAGLGINETFLNILSKYGFVVPTPIQHKAIPTVMAGEDIIGIAQTGTGKTLAFGVPMLQRLWEGKDTLTPGKKPLGLVLLPTRELAIQVEAVIRKLGGELGVKTAVLIGGENIRRQALQLRQHPNIIIATPGRLLDCVDQRLVNLESTAILVLDEADRMLDMGFAPQINRILGLLPLPSQRQTMLFSATMPEGIVGIAARHMRLPVRVEVAPQGTAAEKVEQEIYFVSKDNKLKLTAELLTKNSGRVLIFTRTKHGAHHVRRQLEDLGFQAAEIHADRTLAQRVNALEGFKKGTYRILVATDIAARGIDVKGIELVLNFDLPDNSQDYVHRIGRTGRAGHTGRAISLATPDQRSDVRDIERLMRKNLPVTRHPELSVELPAIPAAQRGIAGGRVRRFGHRRRFGGRR